MDNLEQIEQEVDSKIINTRGNYSIKASEHNAILKKVLSKVGKYTGFPFKATLDPKATITDGSLSFGGMAFNDTSLVLTFTAKTLDGYDVSNYFLGSDEGAYLQIKDYKGRAGFYEMGEVAVVGSPAMVELKLIAQVGTSNYMYSATEENIIFIQVVGGKGNGNGIGNGNGGIGDGNDGEPVINEDQSSFENSIYHYQDVAPIIDDLIFRHNLRSSPYSIVGGGPSGLAQVVYMVRGNGNPITLGKMYGGLNTNPVRHGANAQTSTGAFILNSMYFARIKMQNYRGNYIHSTYASNVSGGIFKFGLLVKGFKVSVGYQKKQVIGGFYSYNIFYVIGLDILDFTCQQAGSPSFPMSSSLYSRVISSVSINCTIGMIQMIREMDLVEEGVVEFMEDFLNLTM